MLNRLVSNMNHPIICLDENSWLRPFLSTLTAICLLAGCRSPVADYSRVDLINGSGQVTLDHQPLAGAVITFEDPADDTFSYAITDDSGKYTLQFDSEMKGVKCGKKIVRISTTRKLLGLNGPAGRDEGDLPAKPSRQAEKVPVRYNRKSELLVEVTRSGGPFNFDLMSK